jgi:phage gpG-like protein
MADPDVDIRGLREFRGGLRRLDNEVAKELTRELRQAVGKVAARAAANVQPYSRSGDLARSYRPFVQAKAAGVRSALPYAGVVEYGGEISPRGVPIRFARRLPIGRAAEAEADRLVDEFGRAVDRAADRVGWRD